MKRASWTPPRTLLWLWCLTALVSGSLLWGAVKIIEGYDRFSFGRHAPVIRKVLRWRHSLMIAVAMPLLALLPQWTLTLGPGGRILWLLGGLVCAEVYSVCLHRESYVAAFEPQNIPLDARPLGHRPLRTSDRRLHYLIRSQCWYLAPVLLVAVSVDINSSLVAWVLCICFIMKYCAPAWVDYEAYFHWDMHCQILAMQSSSRWPSFWRGVCEWLLGPAVGSMPHLYSVEHLVIHHPANAGPRDVHSPLPYERTSIMEFCHYLWKTTFVLATAFGIIQHPRCSARQRWAVGTGVVFVVALCAFLIAVGRPLGYWLASAILFRATNTAMAQYLWHGLHDGSGSNHPRSSTILWLPDSTIFDVTDGHIPSDFSVGLGEHIPNPGSDWAFFDNYHLIHHLHPRAHFEQYPALLVRDLPSILAGKNPVMRLSHYSTFLTDILGGRLDRAASGFVATGPPGANQGVLQDRLHAVGQVRSTVSTVTESVAGTNLDRAMSWMLRKVSRRV